ncbi:hypothetical protein UlMin_025327 [Ulmus minor]
MASAPSNKINRAHQMYCEGRYEEALGFYSEVLAMAKTKLQKTTLHSNRAACYLKFHDFKKLDQNHTGALILRVQNLVILKEYHLALFDVNQLIELNPSSEIRGEIEIYEEKEGGLNVKSKATVQSVDLSSSTTANENVISPKPPTKKVVSEQGKDLKVNFVKNTPLAEVGHLTLDYGRWNRVEDNDDDEDEDEEDQPQDQFCLKTIGV